MAARRPRPYMSATDWPDLVLVLGYIAVGREREKNIEMQEGWLFIKQTHSN